MLTEVSRAGNNNVPPPRGERGFGPDFREKRHPLAAIGRAQRTAQGGKSGGSSIAKLLAEPLGAGKAKQKSEIRGQKTDFGSQKTETPRRGKG